MSITNSDTTESPFLYFVNRLRGLQKSYENNFVSVDNMLLLIKWEVKGL